jgi:hypothetical protein
VTLRGEWVLLRAGPQRYHGSRWHSWGIYYRRADRIYHVMHVPSRRHVTAFYLLRHARRFCEAIDGLADWCQHNPPRDHSLALQLYRAALRITGGRPDFRVVAPADGAP